MPFRYVTAYKAQQSTERGFRFLKDPLFFASSVFLKTPRRIAALAMVMALCLFVYTLAQRTLRQSLAQQETSCKSFLTVNMKNRFNLENSPRLSKTVNNSSKIKPK